MRRVLLSAIAVVAAAAVILLWLWRRSDSGERGHFERDESLLVITGEGYTRARVFRAGDAVDDAREIAAPADGRVWLGPGNYFVSAEQDGRDLFFPVTIPGFRAGPDEGGSLSVTIRKVPSEAPPRLVSNAYGFSYVPSGHFLFGDRLNRREPHYVWLTSYYIGRFEITNAEFREFMNDRAGYSDDSNWTESGRRWKRAARPSASARLTAADSDYNRFGREDQPVTSVSWFEANAFCVWLTRKLGGGKWIFSLPNEAEWEKAARGPDSFDYGLSNELSDEQIKLYNWKKNPGAEVTVVGWAETSALWQPNRYGLFHVSGNAAEWTQSVARPFSRERPFAEDDRNHSNTDGARVLRGGSWYSASIAILYLPYRESFSPDVAAPYLGFRVIARLL